MRDPKVMLILSALAIAGCQSGNAQVSHVENGKAAEVAALDCGIMFTPSSAVAGDVEFINTGASCKSIVDDKGNRVRVFAVAGTIMPYGMYSVGEGYASRLLMVTALYGPGISESQLPLLNMQLTETTKNDNFAYRDLHQTVSVDTNTGTVSGPIYAAKELESNIDYACLITLKQTAANTPLRIILCRSAGKGVPDKDLIKTANDIAWQDIPNINAYRGG